MKRFFTFMVLAFMLVLSACSKAKTKKGARCERTSDCEESGLVCVFDRCRVECADDGDCDPGLQCIFNNDGIGACQLTDDVCDRSSDCPEPLICSPSSAKCVNECGDDRDCFDRGTGFVCNATSRTCYDPEEDAGVDVDACMDCESDTGVRADASQVDAGPALEAVSVGPMNTHAVRGGRLYGWGSNSEGQIGDSTELIRRTPTLIEAIDSVDAVANGNAHACAIRSDELPVCWGANDSSQLGYNEDGVSSSVPGEVYGYLGANPTLIDAGGQHACVAASDGVWCWGSNVYGQCGSILGGARETSFPNQVLEEAVSSLALGDAFTCVVRQDRTVWCWGTGDYGVLGNGAEFGDTETPTQTQDLGGDALSVVAGSNHACAVMLDGSLRCWGDNRRGQLGDGTTTSTTAIRTVSGLTNVAEAALGTEFSCARTTGGAVLCWGVLEYPELGAPTPTLTPTAVSGLDHTSRIVAAGGHACAIQDNELYCWGNNFYSQLGDGTTDSSDWNTVHVTFPD